MLDKGDSYHVNYPKFGIGMLTVGDMKKNRDKIFFI